MDEYWSVLRGGLPSSVTGDGYLIRTVFKVDPTGREDYRVVRVFVPEKGPETPRVNDKTLFED